MSEKRAVKGRNSPSKKAASRKAGKAKKRSSAGKSAGAEGSGKRRSSAAKKSIAGKSAVNKTSARKATARKAAAGKKAVPRRRKRARSLYGHLENRLNEQRELKLNLFRQDLGVGQGGSSNHEGEDDVDRANFDVNREQALSQSNREREELILIAEALERLEQGLYGSCTHCNGSIAEERLEAIPWARHCVDCQELDEKGLLDG